MDGREGGSVSASWRMHDPEQLKSSELLTTFSEGFPGGVGGTRYHIEFRRDSIECKTVGQSF